jgi:hypothetical protein
MGNPTKEFNDFQFLRQSFDGSDAIMRAFTTRANGRAAHVKRLANVPKWVMNNAAVIEVLLRAFPKMKTNPTQRRRAGTWAYIIHHYYRLGETALGVAVQLRHDLGQRASTRLRGGTKSVNPTSADDIENLTKRVQDTIARILRVEQGLRTDRKSRSGKMGRPRKV